jgi:hypothetical protein
MEKSSTNLRPPRTKHNNRSLARWGEATAAEYLTTKGYQILAKNVWFPVGELDLIARNPRGEIIFVEVKTRTSTDFGATEAVTHFKLHKLRKAAYRWLQDQPYATVRFDVISIVATQKDTTLTWHKGVDDGAC